MVSTYVKGIALGAVLLIASMSALWILDQQRTSILSKEIQDMTWEIEDSRLYLEYLSTLNEDSCAVMKARVVQQVGKSDELAKKIDAYKNANMFSEEYYAIKKTFIYKNFELFLNFKSLRDDCGENVNYVIYFYAENDPDQSICPDCAVQADILNTLGNNCENTWIFALPYNSYTDLVNVVRDQYGVTSGPAVVVNGESVHRGMVELSTLEAEITCGENPLE
ncbi:MAG: hypothetical protein KAW41_04730 [Candidatus Diapherotrites archaeon]|nr:hypothetical protein [Candidatus Diapherotrites archaeon]